MEKTQDETVTEMQGGWLQPIVLNERGVSDQAFERISNGIQKAHTRFLEDLLEISEDNGGIGKVIITGEILVDNQRRKVPELNVVLK